ncbi:hypothetical protein CIK06_21500 [Plantactinospora sp. KBS50]|nr:hypothetical protein CIK06_21500 [Plantactinospora sp. KBS50]
MRPAFSPWTRAIGQETYAVLCSARHIHGLPAPANFIRMRPVHSTATMAQPASVPSPTKKPRPDTNGSTGSSSPACPSAIFVRMCRPSAPTARVPSARCADCIRTRCRIISTIRSVATSPIMTVMLSSTSVATPP